MNKDLLRLLRPLLIIFILINAFAITGKSWLEKNSVDQSVLIAGNLLLFLVSLTAFLITYRSLRSSNPQAFVRAMYGSFIAIVAFVYIMVARKNVNKPGLIACGVLYIVYTVLETGALMKLLKQRKNA